MLADVLLAVRRIWAVVGAGVCQGGWIRQCGGVKWYMGIKTAYILQYYRLGIGINKVWGQQRLKGWRPYLGCFRK